MPKEHVHITFLTLWIVFVRILGSRSLTNSYKRPCRLSFIRDSRVPNLFTDPKSFKGNMLNTSEKIDGYFKQLKQLKPFLDTASYPQNLKKLETIFIRRDICKKMYQDHASHLEMKAMLQFVLINENNFICVSGTNPFVQGKDVLSYSN